MTNAEMYDISIAVLIMTIVHLSTMYAGIYVFKFEYTHFVLITTLVGVLSGILASAMSPAWKEKIWEALKMEQKEGIIGKDVVVALCIFLISGIISVSMVYRRFGIGGWLGLAATNIISNLIV